MTHTLTDFVANNGVVAVFLLMAVDALFPLGGELTMVVAGAIAAGAIVGSSAFLGHQLTSGLDTYIVLALAGTFGYLAGSLVGWTIGRRVGPELVDRRGHLVHLGPGNLARAKAWFSEYGARAVFLGRLTPVVRSFISIPAGLFDEPIGRYLLLTLAGSAIWCFGFAGLGWALGSSYTTADHVTRLVEVVVVLGLLAAGLMLWLRRRRQA